MRKTALQNKLFVDDIISSPLSFTNVFWSSAGNIYTNLSQPIIYQPKLDGENKKYKKISIAPSSSYCGLLRLILQRVFCHDLLNKQIYVSQALVEGNTEIQGKQN